jgi:hypothetical protein
MPEQITNNRAQTRTSGFTVLPPQGQGRTRIYGNVAGRQLDE